MRLLESHDGLKLILPNDIIDKVDITNVPCVNKINKTEGRKGNFTVSFTYQ